MTPCPVRHHLSRRRGWKRTERIRKPALAPGPRTQAWLLKPYPPLSSIIGLVVTLFGEEGFKATVDIVKSGFKPTAAFVKPAIPVNIVATVVEAAKEAEKLKEPVEVTMQESGFSVSEGQGQVEPSAPVSEEPTSATPNALTVVADNTAAMAQPAPATSNAGSRSLFKGLGKPKNN